MSRIELDDVRTYCARVYDADRTGHGMDHINRVVGLCELIIAEMDPELINPDIIFTAAYVHDLIDPKVVADVDGARANLAVYLTTLEFSGDESAEIFDIIDHMSFSKNIARRHELTLNGQIVQDADRLDAIGAIGIGRAFYYGGKHGDLLYDPQLLPRDLSDESTYREHTSVINHFYEKLFTLVETLNTEPAKRIGELRNERMRSFVENFKNEWNGQA
ncbi:HD domain-containing protein [Arcanobacterium phocisimile]|uniref:HD domain-containing protein n=1 Tax=Arcanobacterium phocisimile TaxID=1302235 RepID=A0ABX7IGP7_9ACTO|nr:HD domain-containing protein [Arcanobacterium phocisimile]QRV01634.1 HD domain-containing protein [Arcanobacterium phocisimile]